MHPRLKRIAGSVALLACMLLPWGKARSAERVPVLHVEVSEAAPRGALIADLRELQEWEATEWQLTGGDRNSAFELDPVSGRLRLRDVALLDYEQRAQYLLTVRATLPEAVDPAAELFAEDLRQSGEAGWAAANDPTSQLVRIRVHVLDAPEPPRFVAEARQKLEFDNPLREPVLSAVDADAGESLRYEIVSTDDAEAVRLDPATGRLSLASEVEINRDWPRQSVTLQVRVTDSQGLSAVQSFDVDIVSGSGWERYVPEVVAPLAVAAPTTNVDDAASIAGRAPDSQVENAPAARADAILPPLTEQPEFAQVVPEPVVPTTAASESVSQAIETAEPLVVRPAIVVETAESSSGVVRSDESRVGAVTAIPVTPAGLRTGTGNSVRLRPAGENASLLQQLAFNWGLLGLVLCAIAAAVKIALRRRTATIAPATSQPVEVADEIISEEELAAQINSAGQQPSPRAGQRGNSTHRSLRKEMADLLKVSQHFTVKQKAQQQRRFHGRQFWLAAVTLGAAGAIALAQGMMGLDRAFDPRNWIVLGCLTLMAAAALRAFLRVRVAADQMKTPGPLTGEFQVD